MAGAMGICAGLVGPKSENLKKVFVFYRILERVKRALRILSVPWVGREGALFGYFEVAFSCTTVILEHFGLTAGPLGGNFGYKKALLKTHSFPNIC